MGRKHKPIREHDLGLSQEEWAALIGTSRNTIMRIEKQRREHPYEFAVFALLCHDIPAGIQTLLRAWWRRTPYDARHFEILKLIAKRHFTRNEYPLWEDKMYAKHPQYFSEEQMTAA